MQRTKQSIVWIAALAVMESAAGAQPIEPAPPAEIVDTAPPVATGEIRGRVSDAAGDPVIGAIVVFAGTTSGAISEVDGSFTITGVAGGDHRLEISAMGFEPRLVPVRVIDGGIARVEVALAISELPSEVIVVVGTRAPEKRLDAPVTVEVVREHDLRTASGPSYLSSLSRVKGIDYADAGIADQRISARGFATQFNSRMLTMVDGRLAQLPGNGLPQGDLLPTTSLDMKAVEVVVGPASALYGPNAHTGVVNVVTKTPWDESGAAVSLRGGTRGVAGGSARLAGTAARVLGWKLTGEYLQASDFVPDRDTHDFGTGVSERDLIDGHDVQLGKGGGTLYYRRGDWTAQAGAALSRTTGFSITNAGRNHLRDWEVQTQTAQLAGPHVYAQVTRTASDAGGSYQLDRLARTVEAMGGVDEAGLDDLRDMIAFVDESQLLDSELQLRHEIRRVRLTAGAGARRYLPRSAGTYLDDATRSIQLDELGAYGQLDTTILGDRLRLAAAGRVDHHELYATQLSPKAAVQYAVAPEHNVRVGYHRAFKSPTALENFLRINDVLLGNRTGFVVRDADGAVIDELAPLRPEQVDAFEVGYKAAVTPALYVDAVAYWSFYRDFISPLTRVADPAAGTFAEYPDGTPVAEGTAAEGTLSTYVNFGRAQVRGADLGVDYRPVERLSLSASASLLQLASFSNDSAQRDLLLNAPSLKLRASAEVTAGRGFVRVDGRYHDAYAFESGYWSTATLLGGDLGARVVVDATAGYALPRDLSISATVSNLFDDRTPDVLGAPRPSRYAWLQLSYRYAGLAY